MHFPGPRGMIVGQVTDPAEALDTQQHCGHRDIADSGAPERILRTRTSWRPYRYHRPCGEVSIFLREHLRTRLLRADWCAFFREWIATVPTWPSNFKYCDMAEVAINLSKKLRDPAGEHTCDIIIALTHARYDITTFSTASTS